MTDLAMIKKKQSLLCNGIRHRKILIKRTFLMYEDPVDILVSSYQKQIQSLNDRIAYLESKQQTSFENFYQPLHQSISPPLLNSTKKDSIKSESQCKFEFTKKDSIFFIKKLLQELKHEKKLRETAEMNYRSMEILKSQSDDTVKKQQKRIQELNKQKTEKENDTSNEVSILQAQNKELLTRLHEIEKSYANQHELINQLSTFQDSLYKDNTDFSNTNQELEQEISKLQAKCQTLQEENDNYQKLILKTEEEESLEQLQMENELLREENADLMSQIQRLIQNQLHSAIQGLDEVRQDNNSLQEKARDLDTLVAENQLLRHRVFTLEQDLQDYQRLQNENQELKKKRCNTDLLINEVSAMRERVASIVQRSTEESNGYSELLKENEQLKENYKQMMKETNDLKKRIEILQLGK